MRKNGIVVVEETKQEEDEVKQTEDDLLAEDPDLFRKSRK